MAMDAVSSFDDSNRVPADNFAREEDISISVLARFR
jgi:hypothetical protein